MTRMPPESRLSHHIDVDLGLSASLLIGGTAITAGDRAIRQCENSGDGGIS